ncbi:Cobalamin (vitamin B12) biosynthesis CobS, cobalamin-5-phosphate synthase [Candidatus Magnetoovum chiemensis]|nr:Cobalamin (vitamin B12) biosynthesis CobS, cobalamin-5-phosphate synthase [Candidatus Magnetoovum chiemensis]
MFRNIPNKFFLTKAFLQLSLAFQFLTIIPLPFSNRRHREINDESIIGKCSAYFPLVGLFIGVLTASIYLFFISLLPYDIASALVIAVMVIITGGFHLDGVSDTFDALAARKPIAQKLEIMKQGSAGPIGVSAVVLTLLIKFALLKSLIVMGSDDLIYLSVLFPVIGRWCAVCALFYGKSARADGLGALFIRYTGAVELIISTVILLFAVIFLNLYTFGFTFYLILNPIAIILFFYIGVFFTVKFFHGKFNGLTGDNLGFIIEFNEILFLLAYQVYN